MREGGSGREENIAIPGEFSISRPPSFLLDPSFLSLLIIHKLDVHDLELGGFRSL